MFILIVTDTSSIIPTSDIVWRPADRHARTIDHTPVTVTRRSHIHPSGERMSRRPHSTSHARGGRGMVRCAQVPRAPHPAPAARKSMQASDLPAPVLRMPPLSPLRASSRSYSPRRTRRTPLRRTYTTHRGSPRRCADVTAPAPSRRPLPLASLLRAPTSARRRACECPQTCSRRAASHL